jgi:hypothetical protein
LGSTVFGLKKFECHRTNKKSPAREASGISFGHGWGGYLANDNNVAGLGTLGALLNREFDLLAFIQVFEAVALDGREMDEDILAAIASDKAVALGAIEPFDCAGDTSRHVFAPSSKKRKVGL